MTFPGSLRLQLMRIGAPGFVMVEFVPPKVRKLQVRWHSPDFRWLGIADKTYKLSIASSVQSIGTPLARGVWFAYLFSSKNVVVKRVRVRVS